MIRSVLSVAVGFFAAKFIAEKGSARKFTEVAREKAAKVVSATRKAAAAAREELCSTDPKKLGEKG